MWCVICLYDTITCLRALVRPHLCVSHLRTVWSRHIYSGLGTICGPVVRSLRKNAGRIRSRTELQEHKVTLGGLWPG